MYKFKFADIGEGLHEGKVGEIYVKVGDEVSEGDSLFSVETDKVTSDIPAPVSGKITEILIKQGETVHVGDDIFHFDTGEESPQEEVKDEPKVEVKPESKEESGGASVVGEVKVSNDLFDPSSMFANDAKKETYPSPSNESSASANQSTPTKLDLDAINPNGDGEQVDVVVIGAGPGGYSVAEDLGKQNKKVVVIEKSYAGGVCLNVGCIPTKTLLRTSKIFEYVKNASDFGVDVDIKSLSINWKKALERKNKVVKKLTMGVEGLLKSNKVELVYGEAKVVDKHNITVNDRKFTTKTIILATGSRPIHLPLDGFDSPEGKKAIINSTQALELKEIPKTLAIIGGGVIGIEFGFLFHEMGTKVTIVEGTEQVLGPLDGEVKKFMYDLLIKKGIDVKLNALVKRFEKGSLIFEQDGKKHKIEADKILESVGRIPNNLGLDKTLGIQVGKRGEFVVNEYMQTSIPNIFAIGDAIGKSMLAHTAYKHAHVISKFFKGTPIKWDIKKVPACVYTHPEISAIGYTEEELKAEGIDYIKSIWQNAHVGRVLAESETSEGFTKLLVGKKYGQVLGAHIINNHSSDMIAEVAALIEAEGTVYELASTIHPHPSISEAIYEAAVQAERMLEKK